MKARRFPINGTFELTARCNLNCKMCLVRVDHKKIIEQKARECTAEEWIYMAKQVQEAGTLTLLLTGGEIFLRPDFCEIYEEIVQMGFVLSIYTNATMVTKEIMEILRKYPPHKIGVTMYGASNTTYEKLCGCKDGYTRFLEGIKELSTLPSLFDMRTTIVEDNYQDLQLMEYFTKEYFGEEKKLHISRFVVNSIRDSITCPKTVRLLPEKNAEMIYKEIISAVEQIKNKENQDYLLTLPKMKLNKQRLSENEFLFQNCSAGLNQYTIDWRGRMFACELLAEGYTEPLKTGFQEAWELLPNKYPKTKIIDKCATCKYIALCESCPASRLAETGDWFGVPEYSCREAEYIYNILSSIDILEE